MLKIDFIWCAILSCYLGNCQFEDFQTVTEMIVECGENLRRIIQNPEYDSRFYVLRELAKYYHLLDHVEEKLRYKDHDAMEILETIYNRGGPPHLSIVIDYEALQRQYKFREGGMRDVRTIMSDTKELWEKLVTLLHEGKGQSDGRGEASKETKNDSGGQIDLMNKDQAESKGLTDAIAEQDNKGDESEGQIDLITGQDDKEDGNEQGKQDDWFNEEK